MWFLCRMDISKASSEELPRDLEVALEVMLKRCDPKIFGKTCFFLATLNIQLLRMFSLSPYFYSYQWFCYFFWLIESSKPALIVLIN